MFSRCIDWLEGRWFAVGAWFRGLRRRRDPWVLQLNFSPEESARIAAMPCGGGEEIKPLECYVHPVVFEKLVQRAEADGLSAEAAARARFDGRLGEMVRMQAPPPVTEAEKAAASFKRRSASNVCRRCNGSRYIGIDECKACQSTGIAEA